MYYTIYIYIHMYIIWYHSWVDEDHWSAILVIMRIQRVLIIAMSLFFGFGEKRVPCSLEQISKNSDETVDFILFQTLASDPRMRRWSCSCLKNSKGKRWQKPERFGEFGTEVSTTLSTRIINFNISQLISAAAQSFPLPQELEDKFTYFQTQMEERAAKSAKLAWDDWTVSDWTALWLLGFVPDMDTWKMHRLPISAKLLSWCVFFDVMKLVCMAGCSGIDMHFFKRKVNLAHRPSFRFDDV